MSGITASTALWYANRATGSYHSKPLLATAGPEEGCQVLGAVLRRRYVDHLDSGTVSSGQLGPVVILVVSVHGADDPP